MRKTIFWACVLSTVAVSACTTDSVQVQWNRNIRELGINPVYPPREDVRVGDIYVPPQSPSEALRPSDQPGKLDSLLDKEKFVPLGIWYDHIVLGPEIEGFYKDRGQLPDNLASALEDDKLARRLPHLGEAKPNQGGSLYATPEKIVQMQQVAFPEFSVTSSTQGGIEAVIPMEAFTVAFAASGFSIDRVALKIRDAESIGLPLRYVERRAPWTPAALSSATLDLVEECNRNWAYLSQKAMEAGTTINTADGKTFEASSLIEEQNSRKALIKALAELADEVQKRDFAIDKVLELAIAVKTANANHGTFKLKKGETTTSGSLISDSSIAALFEAIAQFSDHQTWLQQLHRAGFASQHDIGTVYDPAKGVTAYIITEVFYARSIDFTCYSSSGFGMRAQLQLNTDFATPKKSPPTGDKPPTPPADKGDGDKGAAVTGETGTPTDAKPTPKAPEPESPLPTARLIEELNASMTRLSGSTRAGGSMQVVSASESAIGLRAVFQRPIAIGTRGVLLQVIGTEFTPATKAAGDQPAKPATYNWSSVYLASGNGDFGDSRSATRTKIALMEMKANANATLK